MHSSVPYLHIDEIQLLHANIRVHMKQLIELANLFVEQYTVLACIITHSTLMSNADRLNAEQRCEKWVVVRKD
jgi:hypothetical protein